MDTGRAFVVDCPTQMSRLSLSSLAVLLPLAALATGCGSVSIILKSPVEKQCGSHGLKGCPELTDGVITYVGGNKDGGKVKIMKGAAQNSPEKVKKFAESLKELEKIPGMSGHAKPLFEVIDILASGKYEEGEEHHHKGKHKGEPGGDDGPGGTSGVVTPATASQKVGCGIAGFATCTWGVPGPFVLTDLAVSSGCSADMIVGTSRSGGTVDSPRWVERNPRFHGASGKLVIRAGEVMFVGVDPSGANDPKCSVSWGGFLPDDAR